MENRFDSQQMTLNDTECSRLAYYILPGTVAVPLSWGGEVVRGHGSPKETDHWKHFVGHVFKYPQSLNFHRRCPIALNKNLV